MEKNANKMEKNANNKEKNANNKEITTMLTNKKNANK